MGLILLFVSVYEYKAVPISRAVMLFPEDNMWLQNLMQALVSVYNQKEHFFVFILI